MTREPIIRTCRDCAQVFQISAEEQGFFQRVAQQTDRAWTLPTRCTYCRKLRRDARLAHQVARAESVWYEVSCVTCGTTFHLSPEDVEYFKRKGYAWPRRCRPCRASAGGSRIAAGSR